ncbi:ROK family protein [Novosphingobium flavum]|uniref:fructokinase n=1 Tax=Novosphingobium aerophilum TaxID=2839843 RepID=A0A7X1F979_9SPHN|nr:ROK family protein [Novosphingobium aerophilum]MBC2652752.1 ROK family protein [Novosphingobium aerophilum]MBC2662904.1 ROK family protein [Novosphingobium aerophilum]
MTTPLIGAIEAGGTKFVIAIARADGTILEQARLDTESPAITMPGVLAFFREAAARHGPIGGLGIGSFGPVDIDRASPTYGSITSTPKPHWSGASYLEWLAPLQVPMLVDTDVNAAALGEWQAGAGQGTGTLAYTTVGTGVGTGLVRRGEPVGGFTHFESGHIRPRHDHARDPFAGTCPYHGDCLEGLASGPAIKARYGQSLDQMADTADAVELLGDYLSDLALSLILLHAPDRLIFGGGVMKAPGLLDSLRLQTERKLAGYVVHPRLDPGLQRYIVGPGLGDLAGITGAIALGRQAMAAPRAGA